MKKNKKGFTLVELLAVIVVLAIIMIIAIPSVMDSMNNARKGSFVIYGQKVLTTAETKVQALVLQGKKPSACYDIVALMGNNVGSYKGYVAIGNIGKATPMTYKVYLKDNNFSIGNVDFSGLTQGSVTSPPATTGFAYPKSCCKTLACATADRHDSASTTPF